MTSVINNQATTYKTNITLQTVVDGVSTPQTTPFVGAWERFANTDIIVAFEGTATIAGAFVQTTSVNPYATPTLSLGAPASATTYSGVCGQIPCDIYAETSAGWWRINVPSVSGGYVIASLRGAGSGAGGGN